MASESKSKSSSNSTNTNKNTTKRKQRYLPYNRSVKKGSYPLRPGVQGFFITCDGGRERQASHESINVIDSFYEELVHGKASGIKLGQLPDKPVNKKTKFTYSDSSSSDDDDDDENEDDDDQKEKEEDKDKPGTHAEDDANHESSIHADPDPHKLEENKDDNKEAATCHKSPEVEVEEPPTKKQCLETNASKHGNVITNKVEEKSIDKLIEAELEELTDRSKRHFNNLDSGCNGVVFVQMRKKDGDPSPKDIVQHMMMSIASTRKHISRFILRVLPVEVTCYASEDEITRAIQPLISQYFPVETQTALKFAVLYEARANTGIDRMKIINAVAKSVPAPHKVDLNNPDKNIVVQIVKTVCLMGVVEKYKELAKYNLRQLSSKP
ncbi:MATH and LRR domain-containing protein PFE0570w isoform X2 [Camellia sinensis]|uniref:MATH and LRR domain-containing protein PFE0570w isoform X2 n=1 Tax=Camellia sinensis TaxID=4442 RepID=UPI001036AD78|nr:MATH and LRR domain-containing protein PFE0570w isoform X2 [Camellia sinensis]